MGNELAEKAYIRTSERDKADHKVMEPMVLKHRWSLGHNYLAGVTLGDWWDMLRNNRFAVDPAYWHRAAFLTGMSVLNSLQRRKEEKLYGAQIEATEIKEAPIFILGHWRSGTTHLHNLMVLNEEQFACGNTYQVTNPHTFISSEEKNAKRFAWFLPETRPMDNMPLTFDAPQEDEFALLLQNQLSLYMGITFPRHEKQYKNYLSFNDATQDELYKWKTSLVHFVKKLTFKYDRRMVLKAPPHTARIRHILDVFPDAKFINIHRDPYTVYQSFRHYCDTAMWYTYLQKPDLNRVYESIIERYNEMYDAYFADRDLIPEGQLYELGFEDLEANPLEKMRELYGTLNLPGFESFEPTLTNYLDSIKGYRKNIYRSLPGATREMIAQEWSRSFEEWGYPV